MSGLVEHNIKKTAKKNTGFRKELDVGDFAELAVMSLPPGGELGEEVHNHADEILVVIRGKGEAVVNGQKRLTRKHDVLFVSAGHRHNLTNTGKRDLKLITVFSPPCFGKKGAGHQAGARKIEERLRHAWEQ